MTRARLTFVERPSPNHDARADGAAIEILLLHYTGMTSAAAALDRLTDPEAKVSAHFTIDEDGTIYRHVDETRRAWHAGVSQWAGQSDINSRSIGIELVNPGHEFGYRAFPEPQIAILERLAEWLMKRHRIAPARVLGHSDVAPARKQDPGERFPWRRLAQSGIGVWPTEIAGPVAGLVGPGDGGEGVRVLQEKLARFGYGLDLSGQYDEATVQVVSAFQRHFRPERITGVADPETMRRLDGLLRAAGLDTGAR